MFSKGSCPNTYTSSGILEKRRCVMIDDSVSTIPPSVKYTSAGETPIGITEYKTGDKELTAVRPLNGAGFFEVFASATFPKNTNLYTDNYGTVTNVANGDPIGTSHDASTTIGQLVTMTSTM